MRRKECTLEYPRWCWCRVRTSCPPLRPPTTYSTAWWSKPSAWAEWGGEECCAVLYSEAMVRRSRLESWRWEKLWISVLHRLRSSVAMVSASFSGARESAAPFPPAISVLRTTRRKTVDCTELIYTIYYKIYNVTNVNKFIRH